MSSGVRVLKHRGNDRLPDLPVARPEKMDRERNREIVRTVKSWIAELEQRRLLRQTEALRAVR